jgi:hypothetical protein
MASSLGCVLGCSFLFLTGCGGPLQVGLVNVPWIGRDASETTGVHDVIANGRDACEVGGGRGEVLRGHVPPCASEEKVTAPVFFSERRPTLAPVPWHGFGVCMNAGAGFTRAEVSLPGISLHPGDVDCEALY